MNLRKINSIVVIIGIILLIAHVIINIRGIYEIIPYSPIFKISGIFVLIFFIIHIIISLYQASKNKRDVKKTYPKVRNDTESQVFSGILMIVFIIIHIITHRLFIQGYPQVIVDIIFFLILGYHLQLSIPRLLMSMGFLTSENDFQRARKISRILVAIFVMISIVSEIVFYIL